MLNLLQEIPGWLSVLVAAGGAVVSGLSLGRSRWAMLLLGGFSAEAVALAFSREASWASGVACGSHRTLAWRLLRRPSWDSQGECWWSRGLRESC